MIGANIFTPSTMLCVCVCVCVRVCVCVWFSIIGSKKYELICQSFIFSHWWYRNYSGFAFCGDIAVYRLKYSVDNTLIVWAMIWQYLCDYFLLFLACLFSFEGQLRIVWILERVTSPDLQTPIPAFINYTTAAYACLLIFPNFSAASCKL